MPSNMGPGAPTRAARYALNTSQPLMAVDAYSACARGEGVGHGAEGAASQQAQLASALERVAGRAPGAHSAAEAGRWAAYT